MRVTIVNQFYRPDIAPTAHLAASLAEHRAALGDQVTVIAGKGAYTAADAAGRGGAGSPNPAVRRVWTPGLGKARHLTRILDYAFFYAFAALRLLTMRRQDVIITLTTPPLISWCAMLHKRLHRRGTRLILWNMDCYPDVAERAGVMKPGGLPARFCHARNRAVFRNLDHLVCLDEAMARLLCANYASCNPDLPVTIVPNWEDASFFPVGAAHPAWEERGTLELEGRFTILYLGNMGYGHDFVTVLQAAEELKEEPVTFLFVGGGRHWQAVKEEAARRGLSNVIVRGYVPKEKTGSVMAAADCALVTLRDDALGIMSPSKIHSNLAMGLPLIYVGPRTSNVDEAIERFGCGVSLRHGDREGLVAFVRRALAGRETFADLRRRARRAFDEAYCDQATLPRFAAAIRHATGLAPDPAAPRDVPAARAHDFASASPASVHQRCGPLGPRREPVAS
jgi:glycosyltransferase involved in cell wall biosynthesis